MRVIQTRLSLNICWLQTARLDSRTWRASKAATVSWRTTCNGVMPDCGASYCIPRLTLSLLTTLKNSRPLKRGCPVSLVCIYDLLYYTKAACCIGQMVKTMKYAFVRVVRNRPIGLQAIEANSLVAAKIRRPSYCKRWNAGSTPGQNILLASVIIWQWNMATIIQW